jgi:serine/threonine-protein kinase
MSPASTSPDDVQDLLGARYRLVEELDRGGMATVWRAYDERLTRTVAVKILDIGTAGDPYACSRVRREARALARLNHPHIANVYDIGTSDDAEYLVIELVEGRSLARVLAERHSLPWPVAVAACAQAADGIAAAHARGVVHRDVSPSNVMITEGGVKLIDFGLCAVEGDHDVDPDGILRGTPAYIAPERLEGEPVGPAADVYSLGVVLYRALTGRLPWLATTAQELLEARLRDAPDPLPPVDGLPTEVADVCLRCLAREPADRPSATEVTAVLRAADMSVDAREEAVVADDDTAETTRMLPWTIAVGASPVRSATVSQRPRLVVAGRWAAGAVATALLAWLAAAVLPGGDATSPRALAAPNGSAGGDASTPARCAVTYQVTSETGTAFTATVTVTNTGTQGLPDGRLMFDFPGSQRVEPSAFWRQDGTTVTSVVQPALREPEGVVQVAIAGQYTETNPLPVVFTVDGGQCTATVLGQAGTRVTTPVPVQADAGQAGTVPTDKHGRKGKGDGGGEGHG